MRAISCLLLLLAATQTAYAQLHKCKDRDGRTTYSGVPCAPGDSAKVLVVPKSSPPPAAPTPASSGAMSKEARAYLADRKKRLAESGEEQHRLDSANARVRQIRIENADPRKCAAARVRMKSKTARDPIGTFYDPDMAELRQAESLYCGP